MTLTVVAFQVLIVLTLAIARLFSRKHLQIAAGLWTAFTLFAVFTSWLMVLQLLTIWLGYQWLRPQLPDDDEKERATSLSTPSFQGGQDPILPAAPPKPTRTVGVRPEPRSEPTKGQGMLAGLERVNERIRQKLEIVRLTNDLETALMVERQFVNAALDVARRQKRIADKGPQFVEDHERARAELAKLLNVSDAPPSLPAEKFAAPNFDVPTNLIERSIAVLIERRVAELRKERDSFLRTCLGELRTDPVLKKLFWKATLDQNQPHLANAFVAFATNRSQSEFRDGGKTVQSKTIRYKTSSLPKATER